MLSGFWSLRGWGFFGESVKAALTEMSGSGHLTNSPLKVKKVWIWQSGGWHIRYSVCHFESLLVCATW